LAIRPEEIIWGGVPLAGIPALDNPPTIPGVTADYLRPRERVFGLVVAGEARAYPLRILSWHELANDRLADKPITLSFCTLCGSGVFYSSQVPDIGTLEFDTSGLLYRSNKLMVDRTTQTLWSNLTGEPVVGRLVQPGRRLEMIPGTLTTWGAWLERHPDTSVLDLKALRRQFAGRTRFDYRPGAADRARSGVSFPVGLESAALARDSEVFTLRVGRSAKAYLLERLLKVGVLNDVLGDEPVVLIADRKSGAVRSYRRGRHEFRLGRSGEILDELGRNWTAGEVALRPPEQTRGLAPLDRLPGHVALWFGWYAFFPHTEVWNG
jgi:hypothetical protein